MNEREQKEVDLFLRVDVGVFFFEMVLCVGSCVCSRFTMEKRSLVTIVAQADVLRTPEKYGGRNDTPK